ncbi:hypothetical protein NW768_010140 [Fusarium equiseti]|uniref:Transcription factor n=1 Tax=Fusarium equiseti TaxID=61235 RepID=A0ABQ8R110_FUSEQ|nr:hypothetical protein NW768_010140 [Fusarium equiseti]
MSSTTLPILEKAPPPAGGSNSGAGDAPEAPAPGRKAKKKFRPVCTICGKPNHNAAVCRDNPNNVTIVSGGSKVTPPGTVISLGSRVQKPKKKKKQKKKKKSEKEVAALAKAAGDMEM